ncbi:hypothetical protein WID27_22155 [Streptomyces sp. F41]|uniref:hypothetical protein n=1 Tax=Streptomyces sp. F41 TaxID=1795888 RepID=UPI0030CE2F79
MRLGTALIRENCQEEFSQVNAHSHGKSHVLSVSGDLVAQRAVENRPLIVIFQVAAQFSQSSRDLSAVLGRKNIDFADQFGIKLGSSVDLVQE